MERQRLGRYEVLAELGRGAMGTVYQARDPHIDRIVAIKTITIQGATAAEQEEYRKRFFREAQAAGKLAHPGIVTIHDVGEDEPTHTPYIVMEYIAGRTLEGYAGGKVPLETSLDLVKQVAEALDYAHSQGIVHRDIKPANVMVTDDGRVKIADFGIAKLTQSEFTVPGQILGTPSHMSPEQLKGEPVTGRSDLFSLGVILYTLLCGEKPFAAETVTAVTFQVAYKDPTAVTVKNPALGPEFNAVITRALAKDPAQRYQRGRELAEDLEDLRAGRAPRHAGGTIAASADRTAVTGSRPPLPALGDATVRSTAAAAAPAPVSGDQPTLVQGSSTVTVPPGPPPVPATVGLTQRLTVLARRRPIQVSAGAIVLLIVLLGWAMSRGTSGARVPAGATGGYVGRADLRFVCVHNFRAADFSLWLDEDQVLIGKLTPRRHEFSQTVHVDAGKRTVRVRIVARDEDYDQTREIKAELPPGGEVTVYATPDRVGNTLTLDIR